MSATLIAAVSDVIATTAPAGDPDAAFARRTRQTTIECALGAASTTGA